MGLVALFVMAVVDCWACLEGEGKSELAPVAKDVVALAVAGGWEVAGVGVLGGRQLVGGGVLPVEGRGGLLQWCGDPPWWMRGWSTGRQWPQ